MKLIITIVKKRLSISSNYAILQKRIVVKHRRKNMKKTKSQDLRKSPTRKPKYPVEHMNVVADPGNSNSLIYLNHKAREQTWMTEEKIERFAAEMIQWAYESQDATKLSKFFHMKGIRNKIALEWCKKWPNFAEDYQLAKEIIGDRREDGALNKIFDAGLVARSMPMYDQDWKEETERVAKLRIEVQNAEPVKTKTITVFIPEYYDAREDLEKQKSNQ